MADNLPKLITYRLIKPAPELPEPVQLACHEGRVDGLLAELAVHASAVVPSDAPVRPDVRVRAYNHQLGECGVTVFGAAASSRAFRRGFPRSLDGAPFLLPTSATALRRSLDGWFQAQGIRPAIRGEMDDSARMKVFGQSGGQLFPAPTAVEGEVRKRYRVHVVGRVESVRERFYAISVERKLRHPAVVAISEAARNDLFS